MKKPREFWIGASISGWMAVDSYKAYALIAPNPETAIHVREVIDVSDEVIKAAVKPYDNDLSIAFELGARWMKAKMEGRE